MAAANFRSAKLRRNGNAPRATVPTHALAAGEIAFRLISRVCQAMLLQFNAAFFQILRGTRTSTWGWQALDHGARSGCRMLRFLKRADFDFFSIFSHHPLFSRL